MLSTIFIRRIELRHRVRRRGFDQVDLTANSALVRVNASGIGISTSWSVFGIRFLFQ